VTFKEGSREETREYFLETNIKWLRYSAKPLDWKGIAGIGMVRCTAKVKGKIRQETRYFITSLTDVGQFSRAVREHWGIENRLHWHLDVIWYIKSYSESRHEVIDLGSRKVRWKWDNEHTQRSTERTR